MQEFRSKTTLQFPNSLFKSKKLFRKSFYNLNSDECDEKMKIHNENKNKPNSMNKTINRLPEIKYSWQDLENWLPPSKKKYNNQNYKEYKNDKLNNYSQQVIDISVQTSDSLSKDISFRETNYPCSVKYSWQIIGKATQAALDNSLEVSEENYWDGKVITPNLFNSKNKSMSLTVDAEKHTNNYIVCSQVTHPDVDEKLKTELTDCQVKYSWQNLTEPYLYSNAHN